MKPRETYCIEQRLPGETTWEAVPNILVHRRWQARNELAGCRDWWDDRPPKLRPTFRIAVYRAVPK